MNESDDMTPAERHEFRVSALIVRITAHQRRIAEALASMAEQLVTLASASADLHKAMAELTERADVAGMVHNSIGMGFPGAGVDLGESRTGGSLASGDAG